MSENNTWPGWECVRQLGSGSFGRVYEICRREARKEYKAALKIITIPQNPAEIQSVLDEGMDEQSVTQYFRGMVNDIADEVALMSEFVGNSNIVSYEDHMIREHEGGIGWDILIRMELLTPLQKWSLDHPLSEDDVITLGCDICKALEKCQIKNIIHRDIKPENIFVNEFGDFKLGDFGIARTVEKTVSNLSQKGTYTYIAPEVYKGEAYGRTADIYSLGVVLYRYLNKNRGPFLPLEGPMQYEDRNNALKRRINGEQISSPSDGSRELKEVVLKALSYNPEDRFETAQAFRKALENCYTFVDGREAVRQETEQAQTLRPEIQKQKEEAESQTVISSETDETKTVLLFGQEEEKQEKAAFFTETEAEEEKKQEEWIAEAGGSRANVKRVRGGLKYVIVGGVIAIVFVAVIAVIVRGTSGRISRWVVQTAAKTSEETPVEEEQEEQTVMKPESDESEGTDGAIENALEEDETEETEYVDSADESLEIGRGALMDVPTLRESLFDRAYNHIVDWEFSGDMAEIFPELQDIDIDADGLTDVVWFTRDTESEVYTSKVEIQFGNGNHAEMDGLQCMPNMDLIITFRDINDDAMNEILITSYIESTGGALVTDAALICFEEGTWILHSIMDYETFYMNDENHMIDNYVDSYMNGRNIHVRDIALIENGIVLLGDLGFKDGAAVYFDLFGMKCILEEKSIKVVEVDKENAEKYWPIDMESCSEYQVPDDYYDGQ